MTFIKRASVALTGLAMLATPVAASATTPTAKLSTTAATRIGTPAKGANKLGASVPRTTLISIGILAALVAIVLVSTGGNDDSPASS